MSLLARWRRICRTQSRSSTLRERRKNHTSPVALTPTLASATSTTSLVFANDVPVAAVFARGIDAVSAVFMADQIFNEYWTSRGAAASSEWVGTLPTKRFYFYTDPYYVGAAAVAPFATTYVAGSARVGTLLLANDREEGHDISHTLDPPPPPAPSLCQTTQFVSFNPSSSATSSASGILGSAVPSLAASTFYANGWAQLSLSSGLPSQILVSSDGKSLAGEPVTGFWVTQFVNGNVNGAFANFSATYRHRRHVSCTVISGNSGAVPCS